MNKLAIMALLAGVTAVGAVSATQNVYAYDGNCNGDGEGMGKRFMDGLRARGEHFAEFLGISLDQLNEDRQEMNHEEILAKYGKTEEEFDAYRQQEREKHMKEMGLSDEEIAQRLAQMKARHENGEQQGRMLRHNY